MKEFMKKPEHAGAERRQRMDRRQIADRRQTISDRRLTVDRRQQNAMESKAYDA